MVSPLTVMSESYFPGPQRRGTGGTSTWLGSKIKTLAPSHYKLFCLQPHSKQRSGCEPVEHRS